jgi:crotonobetainyl-CoA:carnitine CoA-transferase CaiB-like acyl-CoA transferase
MPANSLRHVLDGYKVLDFTRYVAGPTATLMMAEMGAEVIKVEPPPDGDPSRRFPTVKAGRSGYFVQHNRGKQSLCVDARAPEGKEILRELVSKVDVLVENFAPGVIGRLGFGYEVVSELNPRAVMCSVSSFGQKGPLSTLAGYDWSGAAYGGIAHMIGEADGPPMVPQVALGDVSTGVHAMSAIACALLARERTGKGQYLDIALLDTYFHYHEAGVQMASLSRGEFKPKRSGRHSYYVAPAGVFKSRNGYIIVFAFEDHHWAALCELMRRPELTIDPRLANNAARVRNLDEVIRVIERWFASLPSDEAAIEALRERRIPHAPVLTVDEAMRHQHLRERGTVRRVRDRLLGEIELPGFALRFSDYPSLTLDAPLLGEHNEGIVTRYLGYAPERVRELERRGVLHSAES